MKKYTVTLECCDLVKVEVEAENENEAFNIARDRVRGNVFGDAFELYEIEEV